jgi:transaldolase
VLTKATDGAPAGEDDLAVVQSVHGIGRTAMAHDDSYLSWAIRSTATRWWHDSADPEELRHGLERGAVGVTTNPYLANLAVRRNRERWGEAIDAVLARGEPPEIKAEALMRIAVTRTAEALLPEHERSGGASGFVCGQVNPGADGDRDAMLAMARRYSRWAPNIAVKLPATASGLDVLETCIAEGITATATVSFTVPQAIAIAERCRAGRARAAAGGREPGRCFAVIMIGRLDDYLREVALDNRARAGDADIRQAGIAVTKRAYAIYRERRYEPELIVAALRGNHHMTEVAGADLIMSIAPPFQETLLVPDIPREERIGVPVAHDVIERLSELVEFRRAYEPDGMGPDEFVSYGVTQRTLAQFWESGWSLLQRFPS